MESLQNGRATVHLDQTAESTGPDDVGAREETPPRDPLADNGDEIQLGAGRKLVVPREDIFLDDAEELDLAELQSKPIRKPWRLEWFALNPSSELTTTLHLHKRDPRDSAVEYYYVDPKLRSAISDELRPVRVVVAHSFRTDSGFLWPILANVENGSYDEVYELLRQSGQFFSEQRLRVFWSKSNQRYCVKRLPISAAPQWPATPTNELLGEALGEEGFIRTADHTIYRALTEGEDLV